MLVELVHRKSERHAGNQPGLFQIIMETMTLSSAYVRPFLLIYMFVSPCYMGSPLLHISSPASCASLSMPRNASVLVMPVKIKVCSGAGNDIAVVYSGFGFGFLRFCMELSAKVPSVRYSQYARDSSKTICRGSTCPLFFQSWAQNIFSTANHPTRHHYMQTCFNEF